MIRKSFTVNCLGRREFAMSFDFQQQAEKFIRDTSCGLTDNIRVAGFNFIRKFSDEELDAWQEHWERLVNEALRLQKQGVERTAANRENPDYFPCEVCGGKHENYKCCDDCSHDRHTCKFCGDWLGHKEVSACYILDRITEQSQSESS